MSNNEGSKEIERVIADIVGGKDAQWIIRYDAPDREWEGKLWNIANEGYYTNMDKLVKLGEKVEETPHYRLFKNIKYVQAPNGQTLTGDFMNLAAFFNNFAAESLKSKKVQVLLRPSDNAVEAGVRLIASNDKEMTADMLDTILDVLMNKHGHVIEFYLWGMQE
jgi:hypothetical protein